MLPRLSAQEALRFETEILPHLDVLYRMAMSVCRDSDLADDIAQESFLKALKGFHGLQPGTDSRSWLARIVHNTCRDHWRGHNRRAEHQWDDDTEAEAEAQSAAVDWQPEILRDAMNDEIEAALSELPPRWRASIQLVDIEGWSYEEAAAGLDMAPGSLRSALHRARRRLYLALQRSGSEGCHEERGTAS